MSEGKSEISRIFFTDVLQAQGIFEAAVVHIFALTFDAAEVRELQISWMQNWSRLQERGGGNTSFSTLST